MAAPESQPLPRPKRRWHRFSLRTLFLLVTLAAIGLGIWTQHMRWYVARLANPETAEAAFDKIIELHAATQPPELRDNVLARREALRQRRTRPFTAWPQKPGSFLPGYVWVLEEGSLFAVSPHGKTHLASIVLNGPAPQVLWNGTLPDGRPGVVVFNASQDKLGNFDGYLIGISTRPESEMPVVRLNVKVTQTDVTAALVPNTATPTIVLRSGDGQYSEEFEFKQGPFDWSDDDNVKTPAGPWQVRGRW